MRIEQLEAEIGIAGHAPDELVRFARVLDGLLDVVTKDAGGWIFRRLFPTTARRVIEIHELLEAFIDRHGTEL